MKTIKEWHKPTGPAAKMFLAYVICPICRREVGINRSVHSIAETGRVYPSMSCPNCPFHEYVTLENWKP